MVSTQTRPGSGQLRLGDYVRLVQRRWWAVLLGLLVGLSGAYAYVSTRTLEYTSTASVQVLVIEATDGGAVANGRTNGVLNLDTEAQLVGSTLVQQRAKELLRTSVPAEELGKNVSVTVPANTSVLDVNFRTDNPEGAAQGAHAFAEAYLGIRTETAKTDIATQVKVVTAQLNGLYAQQKQLSAQLPALPENSPERSAASSRLQTVNDNINTFNQRLVPLQASTVNAGRIITDSQVPPRSSGPLGILAWASGILLGLLIGLMLAFAIERGDKRVRRAVDLERELDVPVLVEVPTGQRTDFSVVQSTHSRQGNAFSELRNVLVSLVSDREQIILVAGASDGPAGSIVAANLAVSLARMNLDTVLVCSDPASSGRQILELDPTAPGLSELLHGGVNVADLEQRPPAGHGLRVIPPGTEAELTSEATQVFLTEQAIRQFRHSARFVVIDAPPMSSGSQAQTLARLAHVTVLVVELGATTHDQVLRAARLIDLVGTRSIGMVAMPRVPVRREKQSAPPAAAAPTRSAEAGPVALSPVVTEGRTGLGSDRYGAEAYGSDRFAAEGYSAEGYGSDSRFAGRANDAEGRPSGLESRLAGATNGVNGRLNGRSTSTVNGSGGTSSASGNGYRAGEDDPAVEAATDEPTRRIARPAAD